MATKTEILRTQIRHLQNRSPFSPFEINLENGDRIVVEHPELIAYDPRDGAEMGTGRLAILTNEVNITTTFESITSVAEIDRGRPLKESNGR